MKIVDDDAKSVPETLERIKNRLTVLESNQTGVVTQLKQINTAISGLEERIDQMNRSMSESSENPSELRQNVAELELGVGEVTKQLNTLVNKSTGNSDSITMLNKELNTLKLNNIDMKNGGAAVRMINSSDNLSRHLGKQVDMLNSSLVVNNRRLDILNSTVLNIERNSTVRINLEHEDVVAINGKVSQLQDDNLNVSSTLQSLNKSCSEQLATLKVDIVSLQQKVSDMDGKQANLLLQHRGEQEGQLNQIVDTRLPKLLHSDINASLVTEPPPPMSKLNRQMQSKDPPDSDDRN